MKQCLLTLAVVWLVTACGSGQVRHRGSPAGPTASTAASSSGAPGPRAGSGSVAAPRASAPRVSSRHVTSEVHQATTTCVDLPESRIVHLAPKLAHLSPPLPAAQTALIVAQRSEARLARARPGGALGRDILATAGARVTALQSINYALERHDSAALANATQTMTILRLRLQSLGRRSRLRGC